MEQRTEQTAPACPSWRACASGGDKAERGGAGGQGQRGRTVAGQKPGRNSLPPSSVPGKKVTGSFLYSILGTLKIESGVAVAVSWGHYRSSCWPRNSKCGPTPHCDGRLRSHLGTKHLLEKWLLVEAVKQPEGRTSIPLRDWECYPEDSGTVNHRGQGQVEGRRPGEASEPRAGPQVM